VNKISVWPLPIETISDFVNYAASEKNLKNTTIKSYLHSIAFYQNLQGLDSSNINSFLPNLLLKGVQNLQFYKNISGNIRRAMTYPVLKILCHQIASSEWSKDSKCVFWTALTVAFFGSFRFGELLSSHKNCFNENETLLWEDIKFSNDSVTIHVKIPKSKKSSGEYIDLFEFPDKRFCPVKALKNLFNVAKFNSPKSPVFAFENGNCLTITTVNNTLHSLLSPLLGKRAVEFSAHSFRAALPSALASCPDLVSDEQIKSWGRWSSDSFRLYTRLKVQQKRYIFGKIVSAIERQKR
jgi:hypothetical protein